MEPNKLLLDLPLLVWIVVVLGRHGWRVRAADRPILWAMTVGALVANAVLYWVVLRPSPVVAGSIESVGVVATHIGLAVSHFKWVVIAHLTTRLALVLAALPDGRPAFAGPAVVRAIAAGAVAGIAASALAWALVILHLSAGTLDRAPWNVFADLGFGWELGVVGGVRNLFSEEALTRLGVQTLALHHLRGRSRHAVVLAVLISALYFELWHNPPGALNGVNFAMGALFATAHHRYGYESAAVGHCVADVLLLSALPALSG